MLRILNTCAAIFPAAIVSLAIFLLLYRYQFHSVQKTAVYFLFAMYLTAMADLVGIPNLFCIRFDVNYNLIPFRYMFSDWENSLLNLLLFMPLGFSLPVLWEKYTGFFQTTLMGFAASALIEFLQLFTYRATDVNDLITNTLGTILGYLIAKVLLQLFPGMQRHYAEKELFALWGLVFGIQFFIVPVLFRVIC